MLRPIRFDIGHCVLPTIAKVATIVEKALQEPAFLPPILFCCFV